MFWFPLFFCFLAMTLASPMPTTTKKPSMCPSYSDGPQINDDFRNYVVTAFNNYRSKMAKGTLKYSSPQAYGASAPSGKNIFKVTYNCEIEATLRTFSKNCVNDAAMKDLHNRPMKFTAATGPYIAIDAIAKNIYDSYGSLDIYTVNNTQIADAWFEQFLYDDTESIGCWYGTKSCIISPSVNYIVCGAYPKRTGDAMYAIGGYAFGKPCIIDADCTKGNHIKCDVSLGLCTK